MLETALAAGVAAAGGHALLGGVLPTPGVSLLIRRYGLDLGAVVSASHNPFADNGIKFFGPDGTKLSDEEEARVEAVLAEPRQPPRPGRVRELHGAGGRLPARARASLRGARPRRQAGPARLRERSHVPRRAGDLQAARRGRHRARGRARRAEHQRRLRVHARRFARRCDPRGRVRRRVRVRRRRRPRARGGPGRHGRRRRRADRARRAPSARRGPPARRRRRGHRDDELRLPPGDGARGHIGRDDAGGRPQRPRRASSSRLGTGR